MNYRGKVKNIVMAFSLCYATQALPAELYIIANSGLSVDQAEIKEIYLGETQFSGSVKLEVTDNAAAQSVFLSKVVGIDKAKYDTLWVKKAFRDGLNQPPVRGSDAEVIEFVKKTPGAIGYVITAPSGVKIIKKY